MDTEQAQDIWKSLCSAMSEIYNKNASVLSFEELYRHAYNLVLHKHGDLLYEGVRETVYTRLHSVAKLVAMSPDDQLLNQICQQWRDHQVTMVMVRDILMYMDRTYVPQNKKMTVYDLGLCAFRDTVARHELVQDRLRKVLLKRVWSERAGCLIDQNCMKCALYMLVDLGIDSRCVYEQDFETYFLEDTRSFYRSESRIFLSQNTCPDYLKKIELRLFQEMERVSSYLHASTGPKLRHIVESELISSHASALIDLEDTGFHSLLKQSEDKLDDLKRMYDLFFQVPRTLDLLRIALYEHVRSMGQQLVNNEINMKEPVGFLRSLLALREKYACVVRVAFHCETPAQKKMKEAFECFINADTRCVLSLVVYIDELMRSGFKGATEREVEQGLDKVIIIFRYFQDKDVFEVLYKQHLAKRLLSQRSSSFEAERQMLAKLKGECGYHYTTKLEGMFTDIKFSRAAMEKYRTHQETRQRCVGGISERSVKNHVVSKLPMVGRVDKTLPCDIDVTMLTAGYWPLNCPSACLLPREASIAAEIFQDFYLSQHTGRKLAWLTSCGTGEVKATFSEVAKHELAVSTYQMCILSLFNTVDYEAELPLKDIAALTNIPSNELKRHLISLCTPKHRILLKRSKGKGLSTDEIFKVNVGFLSKLKRIRVPLVAMKEVADNQNSDTSIPVSVEENRRHLCEATVVRIMKARKCANHNDLIAEVTRQLNKRFYPQPQFIKKSIESLLEREYLERCADDSRSYIYVA